MNDERKEEEQHLSAQVRPLLFPHVWSRDARQALLSEAFFPAHLWILEQIEVDGPAGDFMANCWRTLQQGAADGSLNERLLTTLKPRMAWLNNARSIRSSAPGANCVRTASLKTPTR